MTTKFRRCIARKCWEEIRPDMAFCDTHWNNLLHIHRRDLGNSYRAGQFEKKTKPTRDWKRAIHNAVNYLDAYY